MQGFLKSWAIPKQPPRTKRIRRLAIQVPDHLKSYADFEGTISKGLYGAGKVEIWDKGNYNLVSKKKDKIVFELRGKKLKGKYVLLKTDYGKNTWLFFRIE